MEVRFYPHDKRSLVEYLTIVIVLFRLLIVAQLSLEAPLLALLLLPHNVLAPFVRMIWKKDLWNYTAVQLVWLVRFLLPSPDEKTRTFRMTVLVFFDQTQKSFEYLLPYYLIAPWSWVFIACFVHAGVCTWITFKSKTYLLRLSSGALKYINDTAGSGFRFAALLLLVVLTWEDVSVHPEILLPATFLLLHAFNALRIGRAPILPILFLLQNSLYRSALWDSHVIDLIFILLNLVLFIFLLDPLKKEIRTWRQVRKVRNLSSES